MTRDIRVLGIRPVHPGRGEPPHIELNLELRYLKGSPVASVELSPALALQLLEDLAKAVRATQRHGS